MEQQSARHLASFGRYGDTELLHVNRAELAGLASLAPGGELPTNPVTGLPEAFFFLPFLAGIGGLGAAAGAATAASIPAMTAASLAPAVGGLGALGASMMTPLATGAASGAAAAGTAAATAGELAGAAGAIAPAASAAGEIAGLGGLAGGIPANVASTLAPAAEVAGSGALSSSASALAPELASAAGPEALAAGAGPAQQAALAGPAGNIGAVSPELVNQVALAGPAGQIGPAAAPTAASPMEAALATAGPEAGGAITPAGAEFGPEAAAAAGEVGATGVAEPGLFAQMGGGMDMSSMMQALAPLAMMMGGGGDDKPAKKKGKVADGWSGGSASFPGEDYQGGIDDEWEYYNNGGLIKDYNTGGMVQQPQEPVMQNAGPPVGGGLATLMAPPMMELPEGQMDSPYNGDMQELTAPQPGDDQLIEAMTSVLMGEVPPPQDDAITSAFLQTFGEEALKDLASRVQAMSSGQGGGPMPDGINDAIPATIDGERPAKLSSGEFVIPSDAVAHAGNGDTGAGSQRLQEMVDNLRFSRTGTPEQPPEIDPYMMMPS